MRGFCCRALDCTEGIDHNIFVQARDLYEASLWNLTLIGEAASKLPKPFKESHPHIPWGSIIGTRNQIVHQYWAIDSRIIWDTIRVDVPELFADLSNLIDKLDDEKNP